MSNMTRRIDALERSAGNNRILIVAIKPEEPRDEALSRMDILPGQAHQYTRVTYVIDEFG